MKWTRSVWWVELGGWLMRGLESSSSGSTGGREGGSRVGFGLLLQLGRDEASIRAPFPGSPVPALCPFSRELGL